MQNQYSKPGVRVSETNVRRTVLFTGGKLLELTGHWDWTFQAEQVFCSDVIVPMPPDFEGMKGIVHPDDAALLKGLGQHPFEEPVEAFQLRIITTYGDVQTISGTGLELSAPDTGAYWPDPLAAAIGEQQEREEQRQSQQLGQAYALAERLSETGIITINTSTGEAHISPGAFRLHGLPPQSLNPHLHSFLPLIHQDEREKVRELVDLMYRRRLPVNIDYRLATGRQIGLETFWYQNELGELVLGGQYRSLDAQLAAEEALRQAAIARHFFERQQQFDETTAGLAHWQYHPFTRKVTCSDSLYRLFGIRNTGTGLQFKALLLHIHPEDRMLFETAQRKLVNEHQAPDIRFRVLLPNGKTRYLHQVVTLLNYGSELVATALVQDMTALVVRDEKIAEWENRAERLRIWTNLSEELSGTAGWIWEDDGEQIWWSDGTYRMLGYRPGVSGLTQKGFQLFVYPEDQRNFVAALRHFQAKKQPGEFDFRLSVRGKISHLKAYLRTARSGDNELLVVVLADQTRIQDLETEGQRMGNLVSAVTEHNADRLLITDTFHTITLWNAACEATYGIPANAALGLNFFDVFPVYHDEEEVRLFSQVLKGTPVNLEHQPSRVGRGYYDLQLQPIRNEAGEVTGILHQIRDTTRETELRLQLTERLAFIEGLLESSLDRIIALDRQMNYIYWNQQAEVHYGLRKEEMIGRNILDIYPQLVDDPTYDHFRQVLRGEPVHIPAGDSDLETGAYADISLLPIKNNTGQVSGILWVAHDLRPEFQLQQQRDRAEHILNHINEAYYEVDADLFLRYVNERAQEIWGRERWELVGKKLDKVFPELVHTPQFKMVLEAIREQKDLSGEFFSPVLDRWIYVSATPHDNGAIVLFYDIQEIREARERVRASEALLNEAEKIAHTGSYECQVPTMKIRFSEGMFHIFGVEPGAFEPTLDSIDERSEASDALAVRAILERAIANRQPYQYRRRIFRPDGSQRIVESFGRVECDEQGVVLRLLGTARDITDQEQSNEERRKMEHLMGQTALATPDALTIYDLATQTPIYLNNCLGSWLGYSNQELMELGYEGRLALIHPDDRERLLAFNREMAASEADYLGTIDYRVYTRDGAIRWLRNRSRIFLRDSNGKGIQMLSVLQDVTKENTLQLHLQSRERMRMTKRTNDWFFGK